MLTFSRKVAPLERIERIKAQPLADRARKYVEKMPPAISGNGGHDALFAVACVLIHGFDLPEPEAWLILCEYNARCQPPWSDRELRHKLRSAGQLTRRSRPRGYLRGANVEQEYLPNPENPKAVKWQVTPEPLPAMKSQAPETGPPKTPEPTDTEQYLEAKRISQELAKLYRDGAITGPHDPEARFYARVLRAFSGTYTGKSSTE